MRFARLAELFCVITVAILWVVLTLPARAQEMPAAPSPQTPPAQKPFLGVDYSKSVNAFPHVISPYLPRRVPQANLANTPRIDQLMHDGKIYLSLDDAVALALENNLDIAIQRYNLDIAETDVLRAKSGASILGVNAGLVQNTPGGGVGGIGATAGLSSGGTSLGAGGIGAGTAGLVSSTLGQGPPLTSFDPVIGGTLQMDHLYQLSSNGFNGVPVVNQNTGTANFNYTQGFAWGTNLLIGFNNSHVTTNVPFTTLLPQVTSNFNFKLTQHLMQGFGLAANDRFIHIAKNNRELSDVAFRLQVITTVDQIENLYWDLVYAYENARVQNESLAFAQKTLSDTRKQVEIGSLAPIEVVRAQSTVAQDQQQVTTAQTNLQLEQLLMKNAVTRTLKDAILATAEVIPTSTMEIPAQNDTTPTEDLVNDALRHRPELVESRIDLNSRQYSNKAVRSAMLPTVDLFAYYGGSGLAGTLNPITPFCPSTSGIFCIPPSAIPVQFRSGKPVGYGTALQNMVTSAAPDKGMGLTINIPLRNRAAQSLQVRSVLELRQAEMRMQQIENQVEIEVRNAQYAVQQRRASVDSAKAAVALAQQSLDAEQKKYQFGTSTATLVLQYQSQLATSESTLVDATVAYEKSLLELDRATGTLLDKSGINIDDAAHGKVNALPHVPYIAPRKEAPSELQPAPATPPANSSQP